MSTAMNRTDTTHRADVADVADRACVSLREVVAAVDTVDYEARKLAWLNREQNVRAAMLADAARHPVRGLCGKDCAAGEGGKDAGAMSANWKVGEYYHVPCVKLAQVVIFHHLIRGLDKGEFIPVIGPKHEDAEVIGFPDEHWHIDWRFMKRDLYDQFVERWQGKSSRVEGAEQMVLSNVVRSALTDGKVHTRRLMMLREMPVSPNAISAEEWPLKWSGKPDWFAELEVKYAEARSRCGLCPHRGLPLVKQDAGGRWVCSGHGLAFDALDDGRLVPLNGVGAGNEREPHNG